MNYTQEHTDMAADELFFIDLKERLKEKINSDPSLRNAIRRKRKLKNMDDIIDYYKPKYTFRKADTETKQWQ